MVYEVELAQDWECDFMVTQEVKSEILREIARRIVDVAQPERIILFGSAARGEMTADSDVDMLVVKANVHRRKLAQAISRNLIGVGQAVDVVVITPEDLEQHRNTPGLIIAPALRDGKVVYESTAVST